MYYNGNGIDMSMPVAPAYGAYGGGNGLFGGGSDIWALLFVLALFGGGWGGFGGFGWGGMGLGMGMMGMDGFGLYPWLNSSQNINGGFRDQMLSGKLDQISGSVNDGFRDVLLGQADTSRQICEAGNSITGAMRDGFYGLETAENARQMALLQQLFGIQSAQQQCCYENRAAIADVKYTIATEAANTRAASAADKQQILDKLCQLELDGVKQNYENRIAGMQNALDTERANNQALRFERSQTAQNGFIEREINNQNEVFYNRLMNCPIPATPVFGRTPIFTCQGQNPGCGCPGNAAYGYAA